MQLISYSVLSALILAANAAPSVPENVVGNRHARAPVNHDLKARHARRAAHPAPAPVAIPPTLQTRKGKRDALAKQKKCRLRPTGSSSTLVALPTATLGGSNDNSTLSASTSTSSSSTVEETTTTTSSSSADPSATVEYSSQWKLGRTHQGDTFFNDWTFWDRDDPTHGTVRFQNRDASQAAGLIEITSSGNAIMRSGTHDNVDMRNGVRIHDNEVFNVNTLLLMDSVHMPIGCGVWPAWWANGPNWPYGGEIDILEGVNNQARNQATLHTSDGCTTSSDIATGQMLSANCGVLNGDNSGCGFADTNNDNSYGKSFNDNRGGVYAMQWVNSGISVWFFPRGSIPADIEADHPMPWTWQKPFAHWSSNTCDTNHYFNNNNAIFDITFCGDWAGSDGAWRGSGCADQTGYGSCSDYVRAVGSGFHDAFWEVQYVKYYHQD
jgi:hypothetical protein